MPLLIVREPRPDAPGWCCRRLLAAVDAIAWPLLLTRQAPTASADFAHCATTFIVLIGLRRLCRALWMNHRHWFTTCRWARVLAAVLVFGAVLKASGPAQAGEADAPTLGESASVRHRGAVGAPLLEVAAPPCDGALGQADR